MDRKFVNCGCGKKYSKEWINLDFYEKKGEVVYCNILKGLPFKDNEVDFVYSSNFMEHLTYQQAKEYITECYRVLKSGCHIRIVVPDLEDICKEYLKILENVRLNSEYDNKYKYILIELIDQMTREYSGGLMGEFWNSDLPDKDKDYVYYRHAIKLTNKNIMKNKITKKSERNHLKYFVRKILTDNIFYKTYQAGKFELYGEKHKWMYDSYGLERLLVECGFHNVKQYQYNESSLTNFSSYGLELNDEGLEYKPHCIYMEAEK